MATKPATLPTRLTAVRIRQFQLFTLLANVGSVSEAARQANISQQAAAAMLNDLEGAFNATLFHRSQKGLTLTRAGERVAARAALALREFQWAVAEADSAPHERPIFRVGYQPAYILGGLPRATALFVERFPDVQLSVREMIVPETAQALSQGEIDVAITVNHALLSSPDAANSMSITTLAEYRHCAFASRKMNPMPLGSATIEEIRQLLWVWPSRDSFIRTPMDSWFRQKGAQPPTNVIEVNPIIRGVELLRELPAVLLLRESVAGLDGYAHLVPLPQWDMAIPVRIVYACRRPRFDHELVQGMLRCLQDSERVA